MKNIFFDYTVFCRILAIIFVFSLSSELVCGQTEAEKYYKKAVLCTNNDKKQAKYYEKAAELGHAMSQLEMGVRYENGSGVPQNGAKAVEWYLKAAEQGQDLAYFFLGSLYQYGIQGVEIDYKESSKWYLKAAEQKDTVSFSCMSKVASLLYPDPKNCLQEAVKQHKEGKDVLYAALLKSAAERGEPKAQYLIGRCYCRGIGVEKDYNAAYSWLEKADKQGVDAASDELYFLCDKWSVELQNVYESYSELLDKYKKMRPGAKKQQYLKEINQKGEKMERDFAIVNGYYKKRIASLTTENPTERAETFVASKSSTPVKTKQTVKAEYRKRMIAAINKKTNVASKSNSKTNSDKEAKVTYVTCHICRGKGKVHCLRCCGTGQTPYMKMVGNLSMFAYKTCEGCEGKGNHDCLYCKGLGSVAQKKASIHNTQDIYIIHDNYSFDSNMNEVGTGSNLQLKKTMCSFCNGTGKNPLKSFGPQYTSEVVTLQYCEICGAMSEIHYHDSCPSCLGKGYTESYY